MDYVYKINEQKYIQYLLSTQYLKTYLRRLPTVWIIFCSGGYEDCRQLWMMNY
jgi:hypothetical protein